MKRLIQNLKDNFNVDWREFWIGMGVFFGFFTLIAIGMIVSNTWEFDPMILIFYYVGGFIVSSIFNILNPNNHKK